MWVEPKRNLLSGRSDGRFELQRPDGTYANQRREQCLPRLRAATAELQLLLPDKRRQTQKLGPDSPNFFPIFFKMDSWWFIGGKRELFCVRDERSAARGAIRPLVWGLCCSVDWNVSGRTFHAASTYAYLQRAPKHNPFLISYTHTHE